MLSLTLLLYSTIPVSTSREVIRAFLTLVKLVVLREGVSGKRVNPFDSEVPRFTGFVVPRMGFVPEGPEPDVEYDPCLAPVQGRDRPPWESTLNRARARVTVSTRREAPLECALHGPQLQEASPRRGASAPSPRARAGTEGRGWPANRGGGEEE